MKQMPKGVDGEQQTLFERNEQGSLFNVCRGSGKPSAKPIVAQSELERLTEEQLESRKEALPGQGQLEF